jgi:hypothetical protein
MGKNKRGRPRADRPRYPSGQVKPETAGITWTALQRLRSLGTLPMLETQVGRLVFLGELTPLQGNTAHLIAEIYGRYDRAMGRRRRAPSPAYEVGRGRDGLYESLSDAARAAYAIRKFGELQAEIRLCPRGVKPALEELCVDDRMCPAEWFPAIKIALDMVAMSLGLTRRRASP